VRRDRADIADILVAIAIGVAVLAFLIGIALLDTVL
jgi:hypothetical protein